MNENAEEVNTNTAQVAPVPAEVNTPASVSTNGNEAQPTGSPVDESKKQTAAFIRMRQENRELKRKLASATPVATPAPATPETQAPAQAQPEVKTIPTAPAQVNAANGIEELEKQAIKELGEDKDLSKVPGGVMLVMDKIDTDPRLTRLYNEIDPKLAIREAKSILMSEMGIAPAHTMPMSTTPSGGMSGSNQSLESLINESAKYRPGSKEYSMAAKKINAEMKRLGMS